MDGSVEPPIRQALCVKIMENDVFLEIGINSEEQLYIKPSTAKFPYMYREALEVHWNQEGLFLYSPKPRKW